MRKCVFTVILLFFSIFTGASQAIRSEKEVFRLEPVIGNLEHPWGMTFLPRDKGLLVTERTGALLLIRNGQAQRVSGTPEPAVAGQGGLLDVVLSPNFAEDNLVYISYAEAGEGGFASAVARGKLTLSGEPVWSETQVIYRALPRSFSNRHFGSRLVFDSEGFLYITLGERGDMKRAQDTFDPYGSVLRLHPDGTVPQDNPFAEGGSAPGSGVPEIWSFGHRNIQGMILHPRSGEIWTHEHGPMGGDEVNIIHRGGNYGWPTVTHGVNYDGSVISNLRRAPGMEDALVHWTPSIAPSGMAFYEGNAFPGWQGSIFLGALAGQHLRRLELQGNRVVHQEVLLHRRVGRVRDVEIGPDGKLYLLTDADSGALYRLTPDED